MCKGSRWRVSSKRTHSRPEKHVRVQVPAGPGHSQCAHGSTETQEAGSADTASFLGEEAPLLPPEQRANPATPPATFISLEGETVLTVTGKVRHVSAARMLCTSPRIISLSVCKIAFQAPLSRAPRCGREAREDASDSVTLTRRLLQTPVGRRRPQQVRGLGMYVGKRLAPVGTPKIIPDEERIKRRRDPSEEPGKTKEGFVTVSGEAFLPRRHRRQEPFGAAGTWATRAVNSCSCNTSVRK